MKKPVERAPVFTVDISPSHHCTVYLLLLHLGALCSCLFYELSAPAGCVVLLVISLHGCISWRMINNPNSKHWIFRLRHQGGELQIEREHGWQTVLVEDAVLWRWLTVINLRLIQSGRSCSLVLFPDSCDAEQRRQLQVFLRHCLTASLS